MKLEMCTWDRLLKGSESQVHSVDSTLWGRGAAEAQEVSLWLPMWRMGWRGGFGEVGQVTIVWMSIYGWGQLDLGQCQQER